MRILVTYNPSKRGAVKFLSVIEKKLNEKKVRYDFLSLEDFHKRFDYGKYDICIVLGGDGAVLKTARSVVDFGIPILGVNFGTKGFIVQFTSDEFISFLPHLLSGKYNVEKRNVLKVEIKRYKDNLASGIAVNDCVVKATTSRVIKLSVKINNKYFRDYIGDGIIISTPTGSTAYSFAAYGPIVSPRSDIIILTPLAPFSGLTRSLILLPYDTIDITIPDYKSNKDIINSLDGQLDYPVSSGDKISVSVNKSPLKLIVNKNYNFYSEVNKRLK